MDVTPLVEKRLSTLVERIVDEIHSRFPQGVKSMKSKTSLSTSCWKPKEYALAEEYITYRTQRIFGAQKRQILTLAFINFSTKIRQLSMKMPIKMLDVFNTQRDLTAGIVGKQSVFKCFLSMWRMPIKKGISTITIWTTAPTLL